MAIRTVAIFLAGVFSGIALLLLGGWAWAEYQNWAPYQTPDSKLVARIDAMAAKNARDWNGKPLQVSKYRRWYTQTTQDGRQMILGFWYIPDPKKYQTGVVLGHRIAPRGAIMMLGGGCSQVSVVYDFKNTNWVRAVCNARE